MSDAGEPDQPYSEPVALPVPPAPVRDVRATPATVVAGVVEGGTEALGALEKAWPPGRRFATLPMLAGDASASELAAMSAIPGVAAFSIGSAYSAIEPVLTGIDALVSVEVAARKGVSAAFTLGGIDEQSPESPVLEERDGAFLIASAPPAFPTRRAHLPVVNLSLGPTSIDVPADPRDPVNVATFLASRLVLPVFAAGNEGQRPDRETMSAWAEMPWVIAVGAADDPAGTLLAPRSSAGIHGIPESGPDLVAYGRSTLNVEKAGTSYAAPRVTGHAVFFAAVIWQLAHAVELAEGGDSKGIPLVGWGLVDEFGDDPLPMEPRLDVPALPPVAVDVDAVKRTLAVLADRAVTSDVAVTSERLRRMLLGASRPMAQYGPHLVGAGMISDESVLDWLEDFTGAHFAWLFSPHPPGSEPLRALADIRLLRRDELETLRALVFDTAPVWRYDWGRSAFAMRAAMPRASA